MNAALHGTAALSGLLLLLAATLSCSSDFESADGGSDAAGSGAASTGGSPGGEAGDSGGGVTSGGASSGGGQTSAGTNAGGAAGSGGASTGGGGGVEPEPCPEGDGSPMIRVPEEAGGFCIDAHETTRAEYAEFLEAGPAAPQLDYCAWNVSFEPSEGQNDPDLDMPVVGVDFCDAQAYCTWAGKRLCGRIGGGGDGTDFDEFANAMESEWHAACTRGGTRIFPYGNTYDGTLCNGADYSVDQDAKIAIGESQCEGGYEGIFDMSGNVWEWEDACDGTTGVTDNCRLRGGEFSNPEGFLRCDYGAFYITRDFATNSIGIRCCGP